VKLGVSMDTPKLNIDPPMTLYAWMHA